MPNFRSTATRHSRCTYSWPHGLPPNTSPPKEQSGRIRLETQDVPAFVSEAIHAAGKRAEVPRGFHSDEVESYGLWEKDPAIYWQKMAKKKYSLINTFLDEPRAMAQALSQIVAAGRLAAGRSCARFMSGRSACGTCRSNRKNRSRSKNREKTRVRFIMLAMCGITAKGTGTRSNVWLFLALDLARLASRPIRCSCRHATVIFSTTRMMNPNDLNTNAVLAISRRKGVVPGSRGRNSPRWARCRGSKRRSVPCASKRTAEHGFTCRFPTPKSPAWSAWRP